MPGCVHWLALFAAVLVLSEDARAAACDTEQEMLRVYGDRRAEEMRADNSTTHFRRNFTRGLVSFAIRNGTWHRFYDPKTAVNPARFFGRSSDVAGLRGFHQFAAPTSVFRDVNRWCSRTGGQGFPASMCAQARRTLWLRLGIPDHNESFYVVTIDTVATPLCYRLPMEADPGASHCLGLPDERCFKFGGFTSGGAPEILLINATVSSAVWTFLPVSGGGATRSA
eukprot:m51a1_g4924 hypothetical protein (225) ;mRNA; r:247239-247913